MNFRSHRCGYHLLLDSFTHAQGWFVLHSPAAETSCHHPFKSADLPCSLGMSPVRGHSLAGWFKWRQMAVPDTGSPSVRATLSGLLSQRWCCQSRLLPPGCSRRPCTGCFGAAPCSVVLARQDRKAGIGSQPSRSFDRSGGPFINPGTLIRTPGHRLQHAAHTSRPQNAKLGSNPRIKPNF
jgi:hypothetical protein